MKPFFYFTILVAFLNTSCRQAEVKESTTETTQFTHYVNPFIGTGGHGHTFPGATLPHGMVQLSPDTKTNGWDACGGYHFDDHSIIGFSHTHLSGTGIADYGDVLFMPIVGEKPLVRGEDNDPDKGYRSRFSHDQESSKPGYYSVQLLDDQIHAELTTTLRTGFHRYTYPKGATPKLIIDLTHVLQERFNKNQVNEFKVVNKNTLQGKKNTKGWAKDQTIYFYAEFNQDFDIQFFKDTVAVEAKEELTAKRAKAILTFKNSDQPLLAKVGISAVDFEGAKNNLMTENAQWDFDQVVASAERTWNDALAVIEVEDEQLEQKKILYTSLYHTLIHPNVFSDVDGRYLKMDKTIGQLEEGEKMHTVFSLWDTFRAYHPLQTIIAPEENEQYIRNLLSKYQEGGILPKWELAANYTGTMIGAHAISVITDAYAKGHRNFDVELAMEAMKRSSMYDSSNILAPNKRVLNKMMAPGKYYNETLGYIPGDKDIESVAKAMEFAYNDWALGAFAKSIGQKEDAQYFTDRSKHYKKYFDASTGFMRGKMSDGSWRTPFDPQASKHRKDDYCEGNAWQWTWFVPHDVAGLTALMGGQEKAITKLDQFFSMSSEITGGHRSNDISGMIGQYAHGNEPGHHTTFFYNYLGQPYKTQALVDSVMYHYYFNDPNGVAGNEDCGQMSAWFILNASGIYQFCPGETTYTIGRPIFKNFKYNLPNGKAFEVKTVNNSQTNKYVQKVSLNGKELLTPFIDYQDIAKGGLLEFEMGDQPNKEWGKSQQI